MPRALVHPRLFSRLGMAYDRRITVERYTSAKSPTGADIRTWATLPGHSEMPAAISALSTMQRQSYTGADTRIMLQGYHPEIKTVHRVVELSEGAVYDIIAVDNLYGQLTRLVVTKVVSAT